MAKKSMIAKAKRKQRFEVRSYSSLFRLRPVARVHAPVRSLPYLLPGACPHGRAARRHQVQLVGP